MRKLGVWDCAPECADRAAPVLSLFLVLCFAIASTTFAPPSYAGVISPARSRVSADLAHTVARNHLKHHVAVYGPWGDSRDPELGDSVLIEYEDTPVAYNFKVNPSGHILVPYWKALSPVMLYSTSSSLNAETQAIIAFEIYEAYRAIEKEWDTLQNIEYTETRVGKAWEWLGSSPDTFSLTGRHDYLFAQVGPLLNSEWHQGWPFNRKCPGIDSGEDQCNRTVAGSAAIAQAQIMKYWEWPDSGTGSVSYSWRDTTLSADFSNSSYDWDNILNDLDGANAPQRLAVAKLCVDVGKANETDYGKIESSSSLMANDVLPRYFKYQTSTTSVHRRDYTPTQWFDLLKAEFDANPPRPVELRIKDLDWSKHQVVADGYQTDPTNKIHIVFGWLDEPYEGWYDITSSFAAGGRTWRAAQQRAVIGIEPDKRPAEVKKLQDPKNAECGARCTLKLRVRNRGGAPLPYDARVWYRVRGPGGYRKWVGSKSVAGLEAGTGQWCALQWDIPEDLAEGDYTYDARVYTGGSNRDEPLSDWSDNKPFTIHDPASGLLFDSQFNGSVDGWAQVAGEWSIVSDKYYATEGVAGKLASVSYDVDVADLDYRAKLKRKGCETCANAIMIRGTIEPLGMLNQWNSIYIFQYTNRGNCSVYKYVNGISTVVHPWTATSAINQDENWNTLRVVAEGTNLTFYINGIEVWNGQDSDLISGKVGIRMYRRSDSTGDELLVDWAEANSIAGGTYGCATAGKERNRIDEIGRVKGGDLDDCQSPSE